MSVTSERQQAQRYVLTLLCAGALAICLVVAVNLVVDPFGMFRLVHTPALNEQRPAIYHRVRLLKAYDVRRIGPQVLVLGTSRSHLGLRMSHPGWRAPLSRRYNLAFDGATTQEMYAYLRHAHAVSPLRQVVLGLDSYHSFNVPATTRPDFDQDLLLDGPALKSKLGLLAKDLELLAGVTTLSESWNTIRAQAVPQNQWFAPDGQRLGEVFFHRPGESYVEQGPRHYFDEIDRLEVGFQLEWRIPRRTRVTGLIPVVERHDAETSLSYIEKIIGFCRERSIDLRIFITPSHVHQLEIAAATGGWAAIEQGKRDLVRLLARDAAAHPGAPAVRLYDFSTYSSVTTEPLPPAGSRVEMRYYWDSSHFREIVGDWVLDRLLDAQGAGLPVPDDFGQVLTPENVEQVIVRMRKARARYRRTHGNEVEKIRRWVDDFLQKHGIDRREVVLARV